MLSVLVLVTKRGFVFLFLFELFNHTCLFQRTFTGVAGYVTSTGTSA
jgi:hypothetical protein